MNAYTSSGIRLARVLVGLCAIFPGTLAAQDADIATLLKVQNFIQPQEHDVTLDEYPTLIAVVLPSSPGSVLSATVDLPAPPGGRVTLVDPDEPAQGELLIFIGEAETLGELNATYPDGIYGINIEGANDSPPVHVIPIDLSADGTGTFRGIPKFTPATFTAAKAIDPAAPFLFQWESIPGGADSDAVSFYIQDIPDGNVLFQSPEFGVDELDGTDTFFSVPAGTLAPGTDFEVVLEILHFVDVDTNYTTVVGAYQKSIVMDIRTTGGTDNEAPDFYYSVPADQQGDIARNTVVSFSFSEEMDAMVSASQAITWTGVSDPALFSYRWSPDRRSLFCHYTGPGGLPASGLIGWHLNPPGSSAELRDSAGNALNGSPAGGFQTGTSGSPIPVDVESLIVIKARDFFQSTGGVIDLESYKLLVDAELNGINAVSSIDLAVPGVGTVPGVGEFFGPDHRELEAEAIFAETADLDRIFPSGNYSITLDTFHDGRRIVNLDLAAGSYPPAPTVQNFTATQSVDGEQDFTLQWDAWLGGTTSDFIEVLVEGDTGVPFFQSLDFGQPGALDGTATSVLIPADSLPPGRAFDVEINFAKVTDVNTNQYPGVSAVSGFVSATAFTLHTVGSPIRPRFEFIRVANDQVTLRLSGELGRSYEILTGANLPPASPIHVGQAVDPLSGYRGSMDYLDSGNVPLRFYGAREIDVSPSLIDPDLGGDTGPMLQKKTYPARLAEIRSNHQSVNQHWR